MSDAPSGFQMSGINLTPHSNLRQRKHAPYMKKRVGESGYKDAYLKRTGGHSDAPQSSRGPLPELYICEPLSVRVEVARLM